MIVSRNTPSFIENRERLLRKVVLNFRHQTVDRLLMRTRQHETVKTEKAIEI